MRETLSYCGTFSQKNDPDRFFLSLLAAPGQAEHLWALLAFNQEIAKTREVVTDTTIGLIRLQWWHDALEKIYTSGEILQNEVVQGLAAAIKACDLPQDKFATLIYAREFDVEDRAPATLEGMKNYADFTNTPLLELALRVIGAEENSRDLGIGYGMSGILRAVLYHARARRCYLPEDMLTAAGISPTALFDLKPGEKFPALIKTLAFEAERHLQAARPRTAYTKGMKKLAQLHLRQMKKCAYDPFDKKWIEPPPFWQLRVALAAKI